MAGINDYVGQEFGPFHILAYLDSGQEADVYRCGNVRTGLGWILRLDSQDEANWSGPPRIPPKNASIELPNAMGTRTASLLYWMDSLESRRNDPHGWVTLTVPLYGVLDGTFLIPASAALRVPYALDVDILLQRVPSRNVPNSLIWRDMCMAVAAQAEQPYTLNEPALEWMACPSFLKSVFPYLMLANIEPTALSRILHILNQRSGTTVPLDESLLVRLIVGLSQGVVTKEEVVASLRCKHFRANVSIAEVNQLIAVLQVMHGLYGSRSSGVLVWLAEQLEVAPYDEIDDADEFEVKVEDPNIERFDLFLQAPAGSRQDPVIIVREKSAYYLTVNGRRIPGT